MDLQERLKEVIRTVSEQKQQLEEKKLEIEGQLQKLCTTEAVLLESEKIFAEQQAKIVELDAKVKTQQDRLGQAEEEVQQLKEHCGKAATLMRDLQPLLPAIESATTPTENNDAVEKPKRSPSPDEVMEPEIPVASPEPVNIKLETVDDTEIKHEIDWEMSNRESQKDEPQRFYYCRCKAFFGYTIEQVRQHIRIKTAQEFFACPGVGCALKFSNTDRLKDHAGREHKIIYTKSGCGRCGKLFDKLRDLRKHERQNHPQSKPGMKRVYDLTEDSPANDHHDPSAAASPSDYERSITAGQYFPTVRRALPAKKPSIVMSTTGSSSAS